MRPGGLVGAKYRRFRVRAPWQMASGAILLPAVAVSRERETGFGERVLASDHSNRAKVITMLLALEVQIREASALARVIERGMKSENFSTYLKFRTKVDEMMSLSAIIERRIEDILDLNIKALSQQFVKLNIHALTMLVKSNKSFFGSLAEKRAVPMGIRDVLASELKFLDTVRDRLSQPNCKGQLDQRIFEDLDDVMMAIRTISDRSTSLENFSDPSEEDEGASPPQLPPPSGTQKQG